METLLKHNHTPYNAFLGPIQFNNSLIKLQQCTHSHCCGMYFINPQKHPKNSLRVATLPSSALGSGRDPSFCIISVSDSFLLFWKIQGSRNFFQRRKTVSAKMELSTPWNHPDSSESLSWRCGFRNSPSSECPGACRPAVVKSIVNDVRHVIWASSLFMLDQLDPYSKQIISYNYQPEDKSLNVFLMIVLWLAGVKSASQGQRLKMSSSRKSFRRGCCAR